MPRVVGCYFLSDATNVPKGRYPVPDNGCLVGRKAFGVHRWIVGVTGPGSGDRTTPAPIPDRHPGEKGPHAEEHLAYLHTAHTKHTHSTD
jgi:hypothetical protein